MGRRRTATCVGALTTGKPRVTPLPDEPLGEAITYSPDGKYFFTVSDMQGEPEDADNFILQYTPVAKVAAEQGRGGRRRRAATTARPGSTT